MQRVLEVAEALTLAWLLLGNPTGDPSEPDAVQGRGTRLNFEGLL